MEKVLVAKTLANKLFAAEASIDEALVKASALLNGMIEAKEQLNAAATVGDVAFGEVTKAISALSASRTALPSGVRRTGSSHESDVSPRSRGPGRRRENWRGSAMSTSAQGRASRR